MMMSVTSDNLTVDNFAIYRLFVIHWAGRFLFRARFKSYKLYDKIEKKLEVTVAALPNEHFCASEKLVLGTEMNSSTTSSRILDHCRFNNLVKINERG
jgi:hypothetical protein